MDLRKLKTLIDLVSESGISELEVNEGEDRVRIVNAGSPAPAGQVVYANPAPVQAMQAAPAAEAGKGRRPMIVRRVAKYRIYPDEAQRKRLLAWEGALIELWNAAVEQHQQAHVRRCRCDRGWRRRG